MLVREQNSIRDAIYRGYERVRSLENARYKEAIDKVDDAFQHHAEVEALAAALATAGVTNSDEAAFSILTGRVRGSFGTGGISVDGAFLEKLTEARDVVAKPPDPFMVTPINDMLSIALATSHKKWSQIETSVYLLVADLGAATDISEVERTVRTFTAALA